MLHEDVSDALDMERMIDLQSGIVTVLKWLAQAARA